MKRKKKTRKRRRHSLQTKASIKDEKVLYNLKIFEVKGVVVKIEEMVTVVETVVKKGIMRRMDNQANKTRH
jgi:hypothetical protein